MLGIEIKVQSAERLSLEQIGVFLGASDEVEFQAGNRAEHYGWVNRVLIEQQYASLGRGAKGQLRRYVAKMTAMSRAQVRIVDRAAATGRRTK